MAQKVQLKAKTRAEIGRGAVKRMRARGRRSPAVIYGAHMKPINVAVGGGGIGEGAAQRAPARTCWWICRWTRAARRTTASR